MITLDLIEKKRPTKRKIESTDFRSIWSLLFGSCVCVCVRMMITFSVESIVDSLRELHCAKRIYDACERPFEPILRLSFELSCIVLFCYPMSHSIFSPFTLTTTVTSCEIQVKVRVLTKITTEGIVTHEARPLTYYIRSRRKRTERLMNSVISFTESFVQYLVRN